MTPAELECVPNFSDGRDPDVAAAIRSAITRIRGVRLLDWHADPDHNRSVATFVGAPPALQEAAFAAIARAAERIDLNRHSGVHPRLGATDVCPFVPLSRGDMPRCVDVARALAARVGSELGLPVYLYGEAALRPERRALPTVRRGGFELLRTAIETEPARRPDFGPARVHPRAGAIAIGARGVLVAFNVNLESADLSIARAIARSIRESDGGLPGIRALGFPLEHQGCVQVSINLCSPEVTGLLQVFGMVERLAHQRGVAVRSTELVGLAPRIALDERIARAVHLEGFDPGRHVLEEALRASKGPDFEGSR